ncbi:sensor histidine kinase [Agrobacterium sp. NPDC090273]|uniref:sensor histidine kinase n=1 Tax=Agrobacterium sp. NPDC090273 TaxID=3363919 RepID=UPI00383A283C
MRAATLGFWATFLVTTLVAIGAVAVVRYNTGLSELAATTRQTDVLLAEKLAQHDAHLTALAAVVRMSNDEPAESVQGLAQSVSTFYSRITNIATIRIEGPISRVVTYGAATGPLVSFEPTEGLLLPQRPGDTMVRAIPGAHAYDIYKLVDFNRLLRLRIDATRLLAIEQMPPEYSVGLSLGDSVLFARPTSAPAITSATEALSSSNAGQPLELTVSRVFGPKELLPPLVLIPVLVVLAGALWLVRQYRHASSERRRQEQRAALLEQETQLAHAGRVNALGEMASGIAHELAQPVAAMLAQSQAARRAITINRTDILEQALDANVREAKRAGDILGRMRAYICGADAKIENVSLTDALTGALRLVETDIVQRGIVLETSISEKPCLIAIDVISFQQVIHNLIRNAVDALVNRPAPHIRISAEPQGKEVIITVRDNGPGLDPALIERIFEPFFTTKKDGMGLGLPLCARLIEKMNGTLEAHNDDGACFTIRMPLGSAE